MKLKSTREVVNIYVKYGRRIKQLVPGDSDIDFWITIEKMPYGKEKKFLENFWRIYCFFRKLFPFIEGMAIENEKELKNRIRLGDFDSFQASKNWEIIYQKYRTEDRYELIKEKLRMDMLSIAQRWYSLELMKYIFSSTEEDYQRFPFKIFSRILRFGFYSINYNGKIIYDDYEFLNFIQNRLENKNTREIVKKLIELKNRDYFAKDFSLPTSIFSESLYFLNDVCKEFLKIINFNKFKFKRIKISKLNFESDTKKIIIQKIQPTIKKILSKCTNSIESIVLSSVGPMNFNYKLYLVVKEKIKRKELLKLYENVKQIIKENPLPKRYFNIFRFPIITTSNILKCVLFSDYYSRPFEYFYFIKHSNLLYGKRIKTPIFFNRNLILFNVIPFAVTLPHIIKRLPLSMIIKNRESSPFISLSSIEIFDYVCGIIPATRLLLEKNIVVSTPKEAVLEYYRRYRNKFPLTFYKKYVKFTPDELSNIFTKLYRESYKFLWNQLQAIDDFLSNFTYKDI